MLDSRTQNKKYISRAKCLLRLLQGWFAPYKKRLELLNNFLGSNTYFAIGLLFFTFSGTVRKYTFKFIVYGFSDFTWTEISQMVRAPLSSDILQYYLLGD